jgi:rhamnogalacturonan endolyase
MHDHVYRMGICWQNVAYNQPPHLGYYLPDYIESFQGNDPTGIVEIVKEQEEGKETIYNLMGIPVAKPTKGVYIIKGKKTYIK